MDRIISFLLFAALFYFMMRFGCGSHMVHGHHGMKGIMGEDQTSAGHRKIRYAAWRLNRVAAIPRSSADVPIAFVPVDAWTNSTRSPSSSRTRRRTG